MNFTERLRTTQESRQSLLCIGLDPDPQKIPACLHQHANPVAEFNRRIIEATDDLVCAYKLNLAFYEAMGDRGWQTLRETLTLDSEERHHHCRRQAGRYREFFGDVRALHPG